MIESVAGQLFGAGPGTPVRYALALAFVAYPFLSLPILLWLWQRSAQGREARPLAFERPQPLGRGEPPAVAERLQRVLEQGDRDQRLEASSLLAELGDTSALEAMERLDRELGEETGRLAVLSGGLDRRRAPAPALAPAVDDPEAAARSLLLSERSTPALREAALDFLIDRARPASLAAAGPCRRRTSARASSGSVRTPASCLRRT